jgi:hypothetical protein
MGTDSGARSPARAAPSPAGLTTTAWSPRGDLTVAEWVQQGHWLGVVGRGCGWWVGDWVRYGTARYGDRYGPAAEATGYDVQSLMNMAYVAGRFDADRRRRGLSFSHHAEVAGLPRAEQELWLDRVEAGGLSVRALRAELRYARQRAAARAALAEARRDKTLEPPAILAPGVRRRRASPGQRAEVVCPECGCHFAPAAGRVAAPSAGA